MIRPVHFLQVHTEYEAGLCHFKVDMADFVQQRSFLYHVNDGIEIKSANMRSDELISDEKIIVTVQKRSQSRRSKSPPR